MTDHQNLSNRDLGELIADLVEEALSRDLLMPGYRSVAREIANHAKAQADCPKECWRPK